MAASTSPALWSCESNWLNRKLFCSEPELVRPAGEQARTTARHTASLRCSYSSSCSANKVHSSSNLQSWAWKPHRCLRQTSSANIWLACRTHPGQTPRSHTIWVQFRHPCRAPHDRRTTQPIASEDGATESEKGGLTLPELFAKYTLSGFEDLQDLSGYRQPRRTALRYDAPVLVQLQIMQ